MSGCNYTETSRGCSHGITDKFPCKLCHEERNTINIQEQIALLANRIDELNINTQKEYDNHWNRIKELERYKSLIDSLNNNRNDWREVLPQIDSLIDINKSLIERIEALEKITHFPIKNRPFKCPRCDGVGVDCIIGEFRGLPIKTDKCHTCNGTGIVWG